MKLKKKKVSIGSQVTRQVGKSYGFSLVELVIIVGLMGLTGYLIATLFLGHNALFRLYTAEVGSGSSARLSLDRIVLTTREAESVLASHVFSGTIYTTGLDALVLRLKTVNASGDFVSATYDYIAWYKDASSQNKLVEITEADSQSRRSSGSRLLAENLSSLAFTYNDPTPNQADEVTIRIVTSEAFKNSSSTLETAASVKLRNTSL